MSIIWILSDRDKKGSHTQCYAVADLIPDGKVTFFPIEPEFPWSHLPAEWTPAALWAVRQQFIPPWPDIIIASGSRSVAPTRALVKKTRAKSVFVLNPRRNLLSFDAVIVPEHDRVCGENVLSVTGAIHGLTKEVLNEEAMVWQEKWSTLPRPWVGVVLGGSSKHYRYTKQDAEKLAQTLQRWQHRDGGTLLIVGSRRTDAFLADYLKQNLSSPCYFWDSDAENPYKGILGAADYLIVTGDSVSMLSEACFTGKPVYVAEVDIQKQKFKTFIDSLYERNHARPFLERRQTWDVARLDERTRIQSSLLDKLRLTK